MRRPRGFTLAECMVAIMFISIALFGYVSLHIRLIHSGHKLQVKMVHQEAARFRLVEALSKLRPVPVPVTASGPLQPPSMMTGLPPSATSPGQFALLPPSSPENYPPFAPYYNSPGWVESYAYQNSGYPQSVAYYGTTGSAPGPS
ncbi:MAG: prepilin-type N-terminal cleavage/methylation domain-containing protein, partial [Candidatus Eremiobacterota bacterium]